MSYFFSESKELEYTPPKSRLICDTSSLIFFASFVSSLIQSIKRTAQIKIIHSINYFSRVSKFLFFSCLDLTNWYSLYSQYIAHAEMTTKPINAIAIQIPSCVSGSTTASNIKKSKIFVNPMLLTTKSIFATFQEKIATSAHILNHFFVQKLIT